VAGGADRTGDRNERIRMPAPSRIGAQDPHERPPGASCHRLSPRHAWRSVTPG
jgi:hypothetical protein